MWVGVGRSEVIQLFVGCICWHAITLTCKGLLSIFFFFWLGGLFQISALALLLDI